LVLASLFLAGCQDPGDGVAISHVHGLAFDPTDGPAGALFVATHHGVARGVKDGEAWTWAYVGQDRYDYMGFTQDAVESGTFYSSGHPSNPSAFGGVHLGLRRSQDGAVTWEQRSLKGQVDFHALTSLPGGAGHLAGFFQGVLKVSQDGGATWRDYQQATPIYALAAGEGTLWAGTPSGLKRSADYAAWTDMGAGIAGTVRSVAVSKDGKLILLATGDGLTGTTQRSANGGATWTQLAPPELRDAAAPVLFVIDAQNQAHVFASTADATIFESSDAGETWSKIRQG
jgi:photosystem II stability/assembly factor-like uncharacterized protein